MATWVTHLMIADAVLEAVPGLEQHSFCVGNIAPDCNVENQDWTQFTPPREVTHWMSADRKVAADCERFYRECVERRRKQGVSVQELSFLLGYYTHLVADAEFQRCIRDEERVAAVWRRIGEIAPLKEKAAGMPQNWDSVKQLIGKKDWLNGIAIIEAEYLEAHPRSGYLTEIVGLQDFPDYLDYLPKGAVARKVGVMGGLPKKETGAYPFVAISREEYLTFVKNAVRLAMQGIARE